MSSSDALATVTATLQHLLSSVTASVTTRPPSIARNGMGEQINIFLYSTNYNTAFSNFSMPGEIRDGEHANLPLPLVLKYLITSYGEGDDDISGQQLMGQAMSLLHDHPLLGPEDFEGITPNSNLQQQFERVRITPDILSLDDMSKLWASFQSAEYRLSTGYEVSVVLIESTRESRTPLPVLKRGEDDRGPDVVVAPSAMLSSLRFEKQKPSAELGDIVVMLGSQLSSDDTLVRFQHVQLDDPIDIQPEVNKIASEMSVQLPVPADDVELGSKWPAGFYTLSLLTERQGIRSSSSNSVAMPLSPSIELISPTSAPAGNVVLTIECLPQILEQQSVVLLFGDQTINADSMLTPANPAARTTLVFTIINALVKVTPYVVRLRVDGVDSIPVDFSGSSPQFDISQQVSIT